MPEEIGTLLDSYVKVLRTHATMDFSQSCDRDWNNLQTLLVENPEFAERTISYLVNALQDAAEKRMKSRAERNARSPRKGTSVIKAVDHDGKVGFHYVVVDECVPVISDFICGLEGAGNRAVWHREHGWLPKTSAPILDEIEAFNRAVNVSWGIPRARVDVDQDQIEPGTWTTLPEDAEDWIFDVTDPEEKVVIASADTQTDGTEVAFYTYDLTPAEKHKIRRELQGYDLITWQETVGGDYQGVDSSEHAASVIFVRKNKDDRYEIHPGSDISGEFRKHMKHFFSSRCAYNRFEEVRNLVQERAVAFFNFGGKSLSKRHLDIEISINGQTKTLRGTAGEAERLLKNLTAAHRRF